LLAVSQLGLIIDTIHTSHNTLTNGNQVSIEVFPGTKTGEELREMRNLGFNRASIGAQSFDDEELEYFGRAHDVQTFYKTYNNLRAAGFENLNIDLLFGLPESNMDKWKRSVDKALELEPEHLTAYYWYPTIGSEFYLKMKEGLLKPPQRNDAISQYSYVLEATEKRGLKCYWDFNFSRRTEFEYAIERDAFRFFPLKGFGAGAWSQKGTSHIANTSSLEVYLNNPFEKRTYEYTFDYYIMRMLMFPQGLIFEQFEKFFHEKWSRELITKDLQAVIEKWLEAGLLIGDMNGFRFNSAMKATSTVELAELHTRNIYALT